MKTLLICASFLAFMGGNADAIKFKNDAYKTQTQIKFSAAFGENWKELLTISIEPQQYEVTDAQIAEAKKHHGDKLRIRARGTYPLKNNCPDIPLTPESTAADINTKTFTIKYVKPKGESYYHECIME